jgi:hypothetical protein
MRLADDIKGWARQQSAPVTVAIIASLIVAALTLWFLNLRGMESIVFTDDWPSRPWTVLTYPWAYMPLGSGFSIICFVFLIMWMIWIGMSVEREMGSGRYALFMLAMTVLPALILWTGAKALNTHLALMEPWMPEAAMTIAWCTRNQSAVINMYGILPLSGKWLGWLTVVITLFSMGLGNPVLGALACLHLAVAWAFAADRLPLAFAGGVRRAKKDEVQATRAQARYDETYYDEVRKREKEREERERLRKLFESSLNDEEGGRP